MDFEHKIAFDDIRARLDRITALLEQQKIREEHMMADLTKLQAAIAAEDVAINKVIAGYNALVAQIAALEPTQEAIDALTADATQQAAALNALAVPATAPGT